MRDVKKLLKNVEENIPLAPYTSFKIGGQARYFYIAKTAREIKEAVQAAGDLKVSYYIIGNGTNLLVSDNGFNGLVIKALNAKCEIRDALITSEAGVNISKLVMESVNAGLAGLEWMIGIPGTVGGAIYGNAGAFGHSISENVEQAEVLDPADLSIKRLDKENCKFGYRDSVFKERKYIILNVRLKLEKGDKAESKDLIKEYLGKRGRHPLGYPNAGSIFKNPLIAENMKAFEKILKKFPEAEKFRVAGKIPAGWLIEEYGLLGKKIGGAMISKEHGNFILNADNAKATDVITLISLIKQKIRVNFGIQLEEEIQYAGF